MKDLLKLWNKLHDSMEKDRWNCESHAAYLIKIVNRMKSYNNQLWASRVTACFTNSGFESLPHYNKMENTHAKYQIVGKLIPGFTIQESVTHTVNRYRRYVEHDLRYLLLQGVSNG